MKLQFTFQQDRTGKILFSVMWVKKREKAFSDATLLHTNIKHSKIC